MLGVSLRHGRRVGAEFRGTEIISRTNFSKNDLFRKKFHFQRQKFLKTLFYSSTVFYLSLLSEIRYSIVTFFLTKTLYFRAKIPLLHLFLVSSYFDNIR